LNVDKNLLRQKHTLPEFSSKLEPTDTFFVVIDASATVNGSNIGVWLKTHPPSCGSCSRYVAARFRIEVGFCFALCNLDSISSTGLRRIQGALRFWQSQPLVQERSRRQTSLYCRSLEGRAVGFRFDGSLGYWKCEYHAEPIAQNATVKVWEKRTYGQGCDSAACPSIPPYLPLFPKTSYKGLMACFDVEDLSDVCFTFRNTTKKIFANKRVLSSLSDYFASS
jgi:hypothetical protein